MKYISLSLAALLCAISPTVAGEADQHSDIQQVIQSNLSNNTSFVQAVRQQYIEGKYTRFFEKMESDYAQSQQDSSLEGLIAMRKEDAHIAASQSETIQQWNLLAEKWNQERNKELSKVLETSDESLLAQKIRSITQPIDPKAQETIDYFLHLRTLVSGEGKNADENLLIEQDLELEYKQMHLDSLFTFDHWNADHKEQRLALRMEAMDKALAASQQFTDKELKQKVEHLATLLDAYYAKQMDLQDLHQLSIGAIVPASDLEKKAAAILSAYEGKFSDLTKDLLQQTHSASLNQ